MELAVCIPARDEAQHIGPCLEALSAQVGAHIDHIVVLVNNSSDATAAIARSVRFHPRTRLEVIEQNLPPEHANAGHARRLVMDAGVRLISPDSILLTTDADGLVDPNWAASTMKAFGDGADVVAGWVDLHPRDWGRIPRRLHEDDARECAYDALCDKMHAQLDPDPTDPWPRHTQHSGASIAVRASAFMCCGGVPPIASGEDRALIAALRQVDACIRHAPEVHVTVSGRTMGRAVGGMADTIRRRLHQPDKFLDLRLEPALDCARRARARAALKALYAHGGNATLLSQELRLPCNRLLSFLDLSYFGQAWHAVEQASPTLQRRLVLVTDLQREMMTAREILLRLSLANHHVGCQIHSAPFADNLRLQAD